MPIPHAWPPLPDEVFIERMLTSDAALGDGDVGVTLDCRLCVPISVPSTPIIVGTTCVDPPIETPELAWTSSTNASIPFTVVALTVN